MHKPTVMDYASIVLSTLNPNVPSHTGQWHLEYEYHRPYFSAYIFCGPLEEKVICFHTTHVDKAFLLALSFTLQVQAKLTDKQSFLGLTGEGKGGALAARVAQHARRLSKDCCVQAHVFNAEAEKSQKKPNPKKEEVAAMRMPLLFWGGQRRPVTHHAHTAEVYFDCAQNITLQPEFIL